MDMGEYSNEYFMSILDKVKKYKKDAAITQKNIEESREEILAKGKKFRYPFQYAKHRLVINTILICIVALAAFVGLGWLELYRFQSTGDVIYRFTRFIPVSVAKIDGHDVRYSDYLMLYRSSVTSIEYQQGKFDDSEDSQQLLAQYKRQALNEAENYTYINAKMKELNITITDEELDAVIEEHKIVDGEKRDDAVFETVVRDNFGLSLKEYRHLLELSLARKKVAEAMDSDAKALVEEVKVKLAANGNDFEKMGNEYGMNELFNYEKVEGVSIANLDGGRAKAASELEENGAVSDWFVSKNGDGYYIVKLVEKTDGKVSYESIWIRFSMLANELQKIRDDKKIEEYIKIDLKETPGTEIPDTDVEATDEPGAEEKDN